MSTVDQSVSHSKVDNVGQTISPDSEPLSPLAMVRHRIFRSYKLIQSADMVGNRLGCDVAFFGFRISEPSQ